MREIVRNILCLETEERVRAEKNESERRTKRKKRNCFSAAAATAAVAACGMIQYRPRSNGKDSQSDNKGHKRSRLHVNWACLPCTARRQQHSHT